MNKKIKSTYDEFIESLSKKEREDFEKGYKDFLLSEMLIALMQEKEVSVRKLAKEVGLSALEIEGSLESLQNKIFRLFF